MAPKNGSSRKKRKKKQKMSQKRIMLVVKLKMLVNQKIFDI